LLTSTSTGPSSRSTTATIAATAGPSETSAFTGIALRPSPRIAATAAFASPPRSLKFTATLAPAPASASATALPMPREPPGTGAPRWLRSIVTGILCLRLMSSGPAPARQKRGIAHNCGGDCAPLPKSPLESTLYLPVKRFLEKLGYEVKGEVCGCDLVALGA